MEEKIRGLCAAYRITQQEEIQLTIKAILQDNNALVSQFFTPKNWKKFKSQIVSFNPISKKYQIYTRLPIQSKPPTSQVVKCVVMGPCGNGKTSLINHLCGSNLPTGHVKSSLTRDITELKSQIKYDQNFVIYDTPGTTSKEDKLRHAIHLKELINFKPINSILILVKYDSRYQEIVENIFKQTKMLQGYEANIIFAVSHFDLAEDPNLVVKELDKMFNQLKINNQIIFYSNKSVDKKDLCDKVYQISKSFPQRKIQIDEKTFFTYFNLSKEETEEMIFKGEEQRITKDLEQITEIYIENAVILPQNDERDAIFQDLQCALRNEMLDEFDKFVKRFQNTMSTLEYYTSYYKLQLKINENLSKYEQKIRSLQNYIFIESTDKGDIRDFIKKCPNTKCGLIWFRVEECPSTVCGKRPTCIFDFMRSRYFRYRIIRDKKTRKLRIQKVEEIINKNKKKLQKINRNRKKIRQIEEVVLQQQVQIQMMMVKVKQLHETLQKQQDAKESNNKDNSLLQQGYDIQKRIDSISIEILKIKQGQYYNVRSYTSQIQNSFWSQYEQRGIINIGAEKNIDSEQQKIKVLLSELQKIFKSQQKSISEMTNQIMATFYGNVKNKQVMKQRIQNIIQHHSKLTARTDAQSSTNANSQKSNQQKIGEILNEIEKIFDNLYEELSKPISINPAGERAYQPISTRFPQTQSKEELPKKVSKPLGCGQYMNFRTLPRLQNVEKILIEWFQVKTFEQVQLKINEQQKLFEQKVKLENEIKKKFQKFKY